MEDPWPRNNTHNSQDFFMGLLSAERNHWPLAIRWCVVRSTLRENLIKTIKWSVELLADFLEPFYMDVGELRTNNRQRGEEVLPTASWYRGHWKALSACWEENGSSADYKYQGFKTSAVKQDNLLRWNKIKLVILLQTVLLFW